MKERVDRREPDVPCSSTVFSITLKVRKKGLNLLRLEIFQIQCRRRAVLMGGKKAQHQNQTVPVALDRVRAHASPNGKMVGKEVLQKDRQQVGPVSFHHKPSSLPPGSERRNGRRRQHWQGWQAVQ